MGYREVINCLGILWEPLVVIRWNKYIDFKVKQAERDRQRNRRTNTERLWVQYESINNIKDQILENGLRENNKQESQSSTLTGHT